MRQGASWLAVCCICLMLCTLPVRAAAGYWITEKDGYIVVLDIESGACVSVTDTPLCTLPAEDQRQIRSGILCPDQTALQSRLEDYCS